MCRNPLQIAMTSNQLGIVYQDRSHMFQIIQKPTDLPTTAKVFIFNFIFYSIVLFLTL